MKKCSHNYEKIQAEASHYDNKDMADRRKSSWSRLASPYVRKALYSDSDRELFLSKIGPYNTPGLTLACGDMQAEAKYFKLLKCSEIDAFDVSRESLNRAEKRCKDLGLNVKCSATDVNNIVLPKKYYGLVVLSHAFHHLEKIEYIAKQIAESMLPDGIFILQDYVGPRCIQFSPQQLSCANKFFKELPAALRTEHSGKVLNEVHPPLRWGLSMNEAIQSPKILASVLSNFSCIKGLLYGGLMHPVLERVSGSFDSSNSNHNVILDKLWALDRKLIDDCEIEPNFCELILVRKDSELCKIHPVEHFKYRPIYTDDRYDWLMESCSKEIWRLRKIVEKQQVLIDRQSKSFLNLTSFKNFIKRISSHKRVY